MKGAFRIFLLTTLLYAVTCVSFVPMALATQVTGTGRVIVIQGDDGQTGRFELPKPPIRVLQKGNTVFAAVPGHGVYVLDITDPASPRLVSIVEKGRDVRDISIRDGALVVTTGELSLQAFDIHAGTPKNIATELLTDQKPSRDLRVGRVVSANRGWAVIELVQNAPVTKGSRVEIRSSRPERVTDPFTGQTTVKPSGRVVFVGDIVEIRDGRASVRLSKGDFPEPGDIVFTSERPISGSLWSPSRPAGLWRASLDLFPQITGQDNDTSEGESFFSTLVHASIYYHGFGPWSAGFELAPFQYFGHSDADGSDAVGGAGYFVANYETDLFAVGIGVGYQYPLMADQSIDGERIEHNRKGWALVEQARLGSLDGLHFLVRYQSVYCRDNAQNQRRGMWGHLYMRLMVPLEMRSDLVLEGLFSNTLIHTTLGVRLAFQGMGGPGTTYLKAYMGYMNFMPYHREYDEYDEKYHASSMEDGGGPVIGLGIEQRW